MAETAPDAAAQTPSIAKAILAALFISWPAFYYPLANFACLPQVDAVSWTAVGLVMLLCLAVGISHAGAGKICATTESADDASIVQPVRDLPKDGSTRIAGAMAAAAGQLCHWLVPSLWLFIATNIGSYIVSTIWPQIPAGSTWILIPLAAALAFGLSYIPSRRAGDVCLATIGVLQAGVVIVFSIMLAVNYRTAQRTGNTPENVLYYPDSPAGNHNVPYEVIDSADANADNLGYPAGNPVAVPPHDSVSKDSGFSMDYTASDALSSGETEVVPAPLEISASRTTPTDGSSQPQDFVYHDAPSAPVPFALRYIYAMTFAALLSAAAFQFIAALGHPSIFKRPIVRGLAIVLLIAVQCGGFCAIQWFARSQLNQGYSFTVTSGQTPMSDLMAIFGTWAFGSYRAGWWFMLSQTVILLLVLLAAVWTSLDSRPGVACMLPQCGPSSDLTAPARRSHTLILLRAGMTVLLCAIMFHQTYASTAVSASAVAVPAQSTAYPVLFSILLSSVSLSTFFLGTTICLVSVAAVRGQPPGKVAKYAIAPVVGLAAGADCIAAQLAGPFVLGWKNDQELLWALLLCAVWGAGVVVRRASCRRPPQSA